MSQASVKIFDDGDSSGGTIAQRIQNALIAQATQNSGPAAPSPTYPFMPWPDTTSGYFKIRNGADTAWIPLWKLDTDYFGMLPASYFRPHAKATPDMTALIDSGKLQNSTTKVSQAQQTTAALTSPTVNPRNDLIVIDQSTAVYSIVAGTEAASPADPAIPSGKIAIGRVRLTVGMSSITDAAIDDLRPGFMVGADLAVANLWTAQQRPKYLNTATAAGGGSFAYDPPTHGQIALITCSTAGTLTFGAPTNIVEGAPYTFMLKAGDTNARTPAWNAAFKWGGASSPITAMSTTSGAIDMINFIGGAGNTLIYNGHKQDVR